MYKATIEKIKESKIIVIVRGVAKEKLLPLAEAMYAGGIRLLECTYDASGKITDEEIAANIEMLSKHFVGRMLIGAGTVLTEKQVALTEAAGGKFIISPDTNVKVIKKTIQLKRKKRRKRRKMIHQMVAFFYKSYIFKKMIRSLPRNVSKMYLFSAILISKKHNTNNLKGE